MTDITANNLSLALLDQQVAGMFAGKKYAFVPVCADKGWQLGVAVANERGYNPINGGKPLTRSQARAKADGLNKHIGLSDDAAWAIVCSTMGGRMVNG